MANPNPSKATQAAAEVAKKRRAALEEKTRELQGAAKQLESLQVAMNALRHQPPSVTEALQAQVKIAADRVKSLEDDLEWIKSGKKDDQKKLAQARAHFQKIEREMYQWETEEEAEESRIANRHPNQDAYDEMFGRLMWLDNTDTPNKKLALTIAQERFDYQQDTLQEYERRFATKTDFLAGDKLEKAKRSLKEREVELEAAKMKFEKALKYREELAVKIQELLRVSVARYPEDAEDQEAQGKDAQEGSS